MVCKLLSLCDLDIFELNPCIVRHWNTVANVCYFQGQAVAQLCSTVPNVTVFGIASCFKHAAIRDSVTHLFDRNVDYIQEVKK